MASPSGTVTYERSGDQARARAEECRERLDRLRAADVCVDRIDLEAAHARLVLAQRRAEAAVQRLEEVRRRYAGHQTRLSLMSQVLWRMPAVLRPDDTAGPALRLSIAVMEGRYDLDDLWLEFMGLGGQAEALEFEAYFHGAWVMSAFDRSVLAHLWWEHERLD